MSHEKLECEKEVLKTVLCIEPYYSFSQADKAKTFSFFFGYASNTNKFPNYLL